MATPRIMQSLFAAGCLATFPIILSAQQTGPDPNNPRRSTTPSSVSTPGTSQNPQNQIAPTLLDTGAGTDQGNIGPFVTMADRQFAQRMAQREMMETDLAQIALEKSDSEAVKQLSRRVIDDDARWTPILQRISARAGIALPAQLDEKNKAEAEKIKALSGASFDQAFFKEMVHLQNRALTMAHYEADHAGVTAFRGWSGMIVADLQEHLHLAKRGLSGQQIASRK